jgi:hypothetical protein
MSSGPVHQPRSVATSLPETTRGRWLVRAVLLLAAAACWYLFSVQIINMFYRSGAYFWDTGWCGFLLTNPSLPPVNPLIIREGDIPSYFALHLALLVPLWGAVSSIFRWNAATAFAAYQGLIHALLFACAFYVAPQVSGGWRRNLLLQISVAAVLTFSPLVLSDIGYPHFELVIPILFLLTCLTLGTRGFLVAVLPWLLMLAAREDAGFHAFAFLATFACAEVLQARKLTRAAKISAFMAAASFVWSCIAFTIKSVWFPQFQTFTSVYAGSPPFAHVTWPLFWHRLWVLIQIHPDLFAILAIPLVAAALKRDARYVAGAVAVLPWTLLQLIAVRDPPSRLFAYYAFPFLIVQFWPWVVPLLQRLNGQPEQGGLAIVPARSNALAASWLVLSIAALALWVTQPLATDRSGPSTAKSIVLNFVPQTTSADIHDIQRTMDALRPKLSTQTQIYVDDAVISLLPQAAGNRNRFYDRTFSPDQLSRPFLLVYFRSYLQAGAISHSAPAKLATHCYTVTDTNLEMRGTLDARVSLSQVADILRPIGCGR